MSALHAIILGLVQGLTEFLPISSSAHLRIVPALFGWPDPGTAFTAVIQIGTIAAVLLYFRADLVHITVAWFRGLRDPIVRRTLESRLGWYIGLGTIPIALLGVIFQHVIETKTRSLYLIGTDLIVLGLVLFLAERVSTRRRELTDLGARDGAIIGAAQALALIPGMSRSGVTITAGLFAGLTREAAARYSFLLSVPAVLAAGLFEAKDIGKPAKAVAGVVGENASTSATLVAAVIAFVVGYAAIAGLLRYLTHHTTTVFVVYRVLVGGLVIGLAAGGAIS